MAASFRVVLALCRCDFASARAYFEACISTMYSSVQHLCSSTSFCDRITIGEAGPSSSPVLGSVRCSYRAANSALGNFSLSWSKNSSGRFSLLWAKQTIVLVYMSLTERMCPKQRTTADRPDRSQSCVGLALYLRVVCRLMMRCETYSHSLEFEPKLSIYGRI